MNINQSYSTPQKLQKHISTTTTKYNVHVFFPHRMFILQLHAERDPTSEVNTHAKIIFCGRKEGRIGGDHHQMISANAVLNTSVLVFCTSGALTMSKMARQCFASSRAAARSGSLAGLASLSSMVRGFSWAPSMRAMRSYVY